MLLNIALGSVEEYIFLSIILVIQTFMTGVSLNLKDLDDTEKKSLMSGDSD